MAANLDAHPETWMFSLVIVRRPSDGRFLCVNESRNRGWWVPGGHVNDGETYEAAALRECKEEAGVNIRLTAILRVEHNWIGQRCRQRVIYLAEPKDESQKPKDFADDESEGAEFLSVEEIEALPHLRGPELLGWAKYVNEGGMAIPLSFLTREGLPPAHKS